MRCFARERKTLLIARERPLIGLAAVTSCDELLDIAIDQLTDGSGERPL